MDGPREVRAPNGTTRWVASDGRTFNSREDAVAASPPGAEYKRPPRPPQPILHLYHLRGDGSSLLSWFPSSRWVVAESAEHALEVCLRNMAVISTKSQGYISVYAYERPTAGFVSLEDPMYRVAKFSEADQRRIMGIE